MRVGMGVDAHAFADGVPLVLAGVRFDHPRGLAGHSDGDVIAHALTDAILGAAGLGDIGSLFPSAPCASRPPVWPPGWGPRRGGGSSTRTAS